MDNNEKLVSGFLLKLDSLNENDDNQNSLNRQTSIKYSKNFDKDHSENKYLLNTVNKLQRESNTKNVDIIYKLAEIADNLDKEGMHKAADLIDNAIKAIAWPNK
jgi:hypothetical protein